MLSKLGSSLPLHLPECRGNRHVPLGLAWLPLAAGDEINYRPEETKITSVLFFGLVLIRDKPENPDSSPGGAAGHAALPAALDEQHRAGGLQAFAHGQAPRGRRGRLLKRSRTYGDQQALAAGRRLGVPASHRDGLEQSDVHDSKGKVSAFCIHIVATQNSRVRGRTPG